MIHLFSVCMGEARALDRSDFKRLRYISETAEDNTINMVYTFQTKSGTGYRLKLVLKR